MHSREQQFSRGRGYPGPLELKDFLALAVHLPPHSLDLGPDEVEVWYGMPLG
jgi:hypothetical protein